MRPLVVLAGLAVVVPLAAPVLAQGTGQHLNFETPPHHPLKVVTLGDRSYLLVANAPDDAVEVWDTTTNTFVARVPVGQEPVTVVARAQPEPNGALRCYTANWLGDSITAFELAQDATSLPPKVTWKLLRTVPVGDEPTGIAILPELQNVPGSRQGKDAWQSLLVTFSAQGTFGWFDADTLAPELRPPPPFAHDSGSIELLDPTGTLALGDPRALAFAPATAAAPNVPNRLWVLGFRGGNDPVSTLDDGYDFDLWASDDLLGSALLERATLPPIGGLGSTNFDLDFASNGDLWVVGQFARNKELPDFVMDAGEDDMRDLAVNQTGFVRNELYRVRGDGSVERLDLDAEGGAMAAQPVVQPAAVAVYGTGAPYTTRVFVAGMGSDSVAAVIPSPAGPSKWRVHRLSVAHRSQPFGASRLDGVWRGPCALALKASGTPNDPADRLYVFNYGTHSISVCDPNVSFATPGRFLLAHFALAHDPTMGHVKEGRKFLYSSELSGARNAACASCHVWGRSDFLAWNLANHHAVPDEGAPTSLPLALGPNAADKGPMQTQSLLGLVNFEVPDNDLIQDLFFSNKPYHWRGDKGTFEQFNAAFVNLMGLPDVSGNASGDANFNEGIPDDAMTKFRRFVFSLHYPPNPEQPRTRAYEGSLYAGGAPPADPVQRAAEANDPAVGSGAARGLKLFHVLPSDGATDLDLDGTNDFGIACVHCHALPEGSNNRLTDAFFHVNSALEAQFTETTQLKGLASKEKRRTRSFAKSGEFGLLHTGQGTFAEAPSVPATVGFGDKTIDEFVGGFFNDSEPPFFVTQTDVADLARYVRQFDRGVGPLVGTTDSIDPARFASHAAAVTGELRSFEAQVAQANVGLAVIARVQGAMHGFVHDLDATAAPYRELAWPGAAPLGDLDRAALLHLLDPADARFAADNLLTLHCTPLGSERRLAWLGGGNAPAPAASRASNVALLGCVPMVANRDVPLMTANWVDLMTIGFPFFSPPPFQSFKPEESIVLYQVSLLFWAQDASPPGFGLTTLRHEPPRRLQLSGDGLELGARVRLWAPTTADIATATWTTPPSTTPVLDKALNPWFLELPIHPALAPDGSVAWQSAAELESMVLYGLINGGPWNLAAALAFTNPLDPLPTSVLFADVMDAKLWNWWYVQVVNDPTQPDATTADFGWQRLYLE